MYASSESRVQSPEGKSRAKGAGRRAEKQNVERRMQNAGENRRQSDGGKEHRAVSISSFRKSRALLCDYPESNRF